MQTNIGQLVSGLFDAYESRYHDPKLAALATEVTLTELLADRERSRRQARSAESRHDQPRRRTRQAA